jgi:hypothetical protein
MFFQLCVTHAKVGVFGLLELSFANLIKTSGGAKFNSWKDSITLVSAQISKNI